MPTPADSLFDRLSRALGDRYVIERELGRGGMAAVFLATDVRLGRQVAIKVLPPEVRETLGVERFEREVQLAARLSHPHIVPLFEAGEADGVAYYVMGYVEGETLKDKLAREGPLALDEAVRLIAEIGEALQYAHEHGIVHRDIKPANILLAHGHAQVADFGIAKAMEASTSGDTLTATGMSVGTAEYMSPEQAAGERRIDARSDVYALAALLYEMLSGEPPFTGPTVQAIVARVIADPPRPIRTIRPNLPPEVEAAVNAGLAKMAADRPSSAQAFVRQLTTRAIPPTRRRLGPAIATALVLAVAAIGALVIVRRHPPPRALPPVGMVLVPAGTYRVGGGPRAVRGVALDSFYIDSTEVTVGQYQRYVIADSLRRRTPPWRTPPDPQWPVTGVLWTEAQQFCAWRTGGKGALPTEDQWEAAARGPQGLTYPWGNAWETGRANADSRTDSLTVVGRFPAGRSPVGAVDMVGNAWEWVDAEEVGPGGQVRHIAKGGAFNSRPQYATAYYRSALPDDRSMIWLTGFRCAQPFSR